MRCVGDQPGSPPARTGQFDIHRTGAPLQAVVAFVAVARATRVAFGAAAGALSGEFGGHRQQHLPEAAQVQILAALVTEPEPVLTQLVVHSKPFPAQTAEHHDGQGAQQDDDAGPLALGLTTAHERGEEEATGHPGGGDPENGQLQVPGADDVAGQECRKIKTVEGAGIGAVVGDQHST